MKIQVAAAVCRECDELSLRVPGLWCAVERRGSSVGGSLTRQLSLRPVAIGAALAATPASKPSMQRTARRFREPAGRNASER